MANVSRSVLSVAVAPGERALLETAAEHVCVNLDDFIRGKAIDAAEMALLDRRIVAIPTKNWDRIEAWVDVSPRDAPGLLQSSAIRSTGLVRPLTGEDDRYAFNCGREPLNRWFWHHAWQDQETDVTRTHTAADPATGDIIGYVSLSLAEIKRVPYASEGTAPDIRPTALPAVRLGQIAIDQRYQHLGHARSLMHFVLASAVNISRNIGCFCMLTHPLDDRVRAFFRTFGFEDIPGDSAGGMAVRIIDLEHNGIGAAV